MCSWLYCKPGGNIQSHIAASDIVLSFFLSGVCAQVLLARSVLLFFFPFFSDCSILGCSFFFKCILIVMMCHLVLFVKENTPTLPCDMYLITFILLKQDKWFVGANFKYVRLNYICFLISCDIVGAFQWPSVEGRTLGCSLVHFLKLNLM